jgi:hypothetical protein
MTKILYNINAGVDMVFEDGVHKLTKMYDVYRNQDSELAFSDAPTIYRDQEGFYYYQTQRSFHRNLLPQEWEFTDPMPVRLGPAE